MHKDTHIYSVDNRCYEQHGHTQKTQLSSDNSPPLLHPPPCHHNSLFVLIQTRGKSLMLCSLIGHNSEASLMLDQWCYRRRGAHNPQCANDHPFMLWIFERQSWPLILRAKWENCAFCLLHWTFQQTELKCFQMMSQWSLGKSSAVFHLL